MASQLRSFLVEPVLEQPADERLRVGQRDDAVANVAGRRDVELLADAPSAATVVGNGDDRRNADLVSLEAAQQGREASAAPDSDDVERWPHRPEAVLGDNFGQPLRAGGQRHQRPDDRVAEAPKGVRQQHGAGDEQQKLAPGMRDELERYCSDDVGG